MNKNLQSLTLSLALVACLFTTACATEPSMRAKIIAMNVATILDVESTYAVLHKCPQCQEANPVLRPMIRRGRLMTYGFEFGINALVTMMARRADTDEDRGSFWHSLPYSIIGSHYFAGLLNLRLANGTIVGQPHVGIPISTAPVAPPGDEPPRSDGPQPQQ